jgi:hypothetical protein
LADAGFAAVTKVESDGATLLLLAVEPARRPDLDSTRRHAPLMMRVRRCGRACAEHACQEH